MKNIDKKIIQRLIEHYGIDDISIALAINEAFKSGVLKRLFDVNGYNHVNRLGEEDAPSQPKAVEFLKTLPIFWDRLMPEDVQQYGSADLVDSIPKHVYALQATEKSSVSSDEKAQPNKYYGEYKSIEDVTDPRLRELILNDQQLRVWGSGSAKTTGARSAENIGRLLGDQLQDLSRFKVPDYAIMILADENEKILYVVSHEDLYQVGGSATRSSVIHWSYKDPDNFENKITQSSWKTDPYVHRIYLITPGMGSIDKKKEENIKSGAKLPKDVKDKLDDIILDIDNINAEIKANNMTIVELKSDKDADNEDEIKELQDKNVTLKGTLKDLVSKYEELNKKNAAWYADVFRKTTPYSNPEHLSNFKILKQYRDSAKSDRILTPKEATALRKDKSTTAYDASYIEMDDKIKKLTQLKSRFSGMDVYQVMDKLKSAVYSNVEDLTSKLKNRILYAIDKKNTEIRDTNIEIISKNKETGSETPLIKKLKKYVEAYEGVDYKEVVEWIERKVKTIDDLIELTAVKDVSKIDTERLKSFIGKLEEIKNGYVTDYNNFGVLWEAIDNDILKAATRIYMILTNKDKNALTFDKQSELSDLLKDKKAADEKIERAEAVKKTYGIRKKRDVTGKLPTVGQTIEDIKAAKKSAFDVKIILRKLKDISVDIPTVKSDFKNKADSTELNNIVSTLSTMTENVMSYVAYYTKPDGSMDDRVTEYSKKYVNSIYEFYIDLLTLIPDGEIDYIEKGELDSLRTKYVELFNGIGGGLYVPLKKGKEKED